jgi:hypothetical protein
VRHRDFRARIHRIGPASRPLDRADATFAVRNGLAGSPVFLDPGSARMATPFVVKPPLR